MSPALPNNSLEQPIEWHHTLTTFVPSAADTKLNGSLCFLGNLNAFFVTCKRHGMSDQTRRVVQRRVQGLSHVSVYIDLVGYANTRNPLAIRSQLLVPLRQVHIRGLARNIKCLANTTQVSACALPMSLLAAVTYQNAAMRPVVVRRMHRSKSLLSGCVPDICATEFVRVSNQHYIDPQSTASWTHQLLFPFHPPLPCGDTASRHTSTSAGQQQSASQGMGADTAIESGLSTHLSRMIVIHEVPLHQLRFPYC